MLSSIAYIQIYVLFMSIRFDFYSNSVQRRARATSVARQVPKSSTTQTSASSSSRDGSKSTQDRRCEDRQRDGKKKDERNEDNANTMLDLLDLDMPLEQKLHLFIDMAKSRTPRKPHSKDLTSVSSLSLSQRSPLISGDKFYLYT